MNKKLESVVLTLLVLAFVVSCAKKGSITGGEKDEIPPVFVKAFPPNFSTNFNRDEIRIYFDEYVKLKDAQKQIIISPPMDPKPEITPLGSASKYIKIKFKDTLLQNTTYSINFGESVEDNNEGNAYPFFRYVFSTGDFLDSLQIKGNVNNAIQKKIDPYITVALYDINDSYNDSLVFNTVPQYITNTLDSTAFHFYNLKEGTYKLIALKDAASNYLYEPKQDQIGFYEEVITLPADTATFFTIDIFKEIPEFKALLPKQASKNEFFFPYQGELDRMKIKLLSDAPDDFRTLLFPDKEKDTVHYWFTPFFEADSLIFEVTNSENYRDTLVTRFKDQYKDSLQITTKFQSVLPLNEKFVLYSNTPIDSVNQELVTLTDKDTVAVPFNIMLDKENNEAQLLFEKTESNSYTLNMLPEAIKDFIGNVNDSIRINFRTKKATDYGTIFLTLQNVPQYPVIVELTNEKDEVIREQFSTKEELLTFEYLDPGTYYLRVILDINKNGKWDTGNFLKGIQPEEIKYFPDAVDVRANWELKQTFILE
ncbi:Ig-like domain-containing protein [Aquimarina sp. U1-2]|uniref:Ig-like domain-containing protein n=1 Tax=Aquimarina sp. U1-2 TaxID=2823141 RepID=UPI001AECE8C1|nr:Ig-like domain-containing protein [Aquimarina sp. U1-2]MBP2831323.1 Ig-like domain-containing protein [Aquimarina sp. U1-2]